MSTIKPTDLTVINRAGVDYRTPVTMSTVQETDLLLVNRGGVDYKCSFADWKAAYVPPASINKPRITSPADGAGRMITPISDEITAVSESNGIIFSDNFTTDNGLFSEVKTNAFDGDASTFAASKTYGIDGGWLQFNVDPAWGLAGELWVNFFKYDSTSAISINGLPYQLASTLPSKTAHGARDKWYLAAADAIRVSTIRFNRPAGNECLVSAFELAGAVLVDGHTVKKLTFATNKDLTLFKPGMAITQSGAAGTSGTVGAVDPVAKTITLSSSTGTWSANTGNWVIGTPTLSGDAALGETPTFTSSAFAITGTGITHGSSDWQVTLQADTGFASPVVQSMADTTHLVRWDGGSLQPNTDYIVRVRHNGGGKSSPWSDVVSFKTKVIFP